MKLLSALWPLALLAASVADAQSSELTTYCNPIDIDYRYSFEQLNRGISYRSGADPGGARELRPERGLVPQPPDLPPRPLSGSPGYGPAHPDRIAPCPSGREAI